MAVQDAARGKKAVGNARGTLGEGYQEVMLRGRGKAMRKVSRRPTQ